MLEAVLTRVREDSARTRIVGLSATVANGDEVADWLGRPADPYRLAAHPADLADPPAPRAEGR
ncbi:hypothetical protein [Streptomyces sp. NPDC048710]|uniref:hypothetical protein n=1 Tax=unclassified Streptomyces TaxID=2593676 RepID=UPI00371643C4